MKSHLSLRRILAAAALAAAGLLAASRADAQLADISDVPLANSSSTSVLRAMTVPSEQGKLRVVVGSKMGEVQ